MSTLFVAYAVLAAFGLGFLIGGWFNYHLGRLVEMRHWSAMMPHVWSFGNDRCTHCGKTMEECGIKSIDASQYLLTLPPDAKEPR